MQTNKKFLSQGIHFTQRPTDGYVDVTQIASGDGKLFGNWKKTKAAERSLATFNDPLRHTNRHMWMSPESLPLYLSWLLASRTPAATLNIGLLQRDLSTPFPTTEDTGSPSVTTKVCACCHEEYVLTDFYPNKRMHDRVDIRCRECYAKNREKNKARNSEKALERYYANREELIKKKSEWNKENKEKVNDANRRSAAKRKEKMKAAVERAVGDTVSSLSLTNVRGDEYKVVCREKDGYIDVTNLCKAGGRTYDTWNRRKATKAFLVELQQDLQRNWNGPQNCRPSDTDAESKLIKFETGHGATQRTWAHPRVALNIAQWVSPAFDVQVTKWVHQLLVTGHVRLTDDPDDQTLLDIQIGRAKYARLLGEGNVTEAEEAENEVYNKLEEMQVRNAALAKAVAGLQEENKTALAENQRLTKYLQRQPRTQYNKGDCIYIVKNPAYLNQYKVGITNNMTDRMGQYNTSSPTEFVMVHLVYTSHNTWLEKEIERDHKDSRCRSNREWYEFECGPSALIDTISGYLPTKRRNTGVK